MESSPLATDLRTRFEAAIAAGKTIALSERELEDARLRAQLPQLLDDLARAHGDSASALRVPGYAVLGEIGQGGMSTVYLARQEALGRHVAIKLAPRWLGGGERAMQRLRQEAQAMARLSHPNIVAIHDVLELDDTVAIVMEWVDGRTLQNLLRMLSGTGSDDEMTLLADALGASAEARQKLEPTATRYFVRLMHDVARAAHAVHECGLLHLDVKPSNVLVRRDGTPLLADFGVVRDMATEEAHTRTFAGTPLYSAPEQLRRQDDRIGPRTDVYGLGMTLYEALARNQPLRGFDLPGILECVETGRIPRLSSQVAVTEDLENIVHKAIAPEPEHRYASAQEFADDLLAFLEHRPVKARPLTRSQLLRRWMRNEPWKAGLAAALLVLVPGLVALGTYLLLQLPELRRIEEQRLLEQANRLKQEAYQDWLAYVTPHEHQVALLEQAVAIDPSDSSLAALALLQGQRHWSLTAKVLERHPEAVARHLGLQVLATRASAGRSFFDDAEVERLLGSTDPIDRYVLALDRFFYSEDRRHMQSRRLALGMLTSASFGGPADPLLGGLLAYVARITQDIVLCKAVLANLRKDWRQDIVAQCWEGIVLEPIDNAAARQSLEAVVDAALDDTRPAALLAKLAVRTDDPDLEQSALRRAAGRGRTSPALRAAEISRWARHAEPREFDALAQTLMDPAAPLQPPVRVRLMPSAKAQQRDQLIEGILTAEPPDHRDLRILYAWTLDHEPDLEQGLIDRIWDHFKAAFPDCRALHPYRYTQLMRQRRSRELKQVVDEFEWSSQQPLEILQQAARLAVQFHNWPALAQISRSWIEIGADTDEDWPEPHYYHGLAAARLQDARRAAKHLASSLASEQPSASWFCAALLEDVVLRASPDSPPEIRDAVMATRRMEQFEALNPQLKQPYASGWVEYARSLVCFANDDREGAIVAAERGLRLRRPDMHAPADWRQRLQTALELYRK